MIKASRSMSADEKRWQAESDARTLSEALVIQKDKQRLKEAALAAKRMMDEKQQEATAFKSVARKAQGPKVSNAKRGNK